MASLFQACKTVVRNQASGTLNIGGYDIGLELYHQSDIDTDVAYGDVAFGDDDESKIVVVADDTITVPEGYTLTPDNPKKSLVIFCNNLVNNGTISMYQKAPNVLPHDYFILESGIAGTAKDIVIPAYADNAAGGHKISKDPFNVCGDNGNNGTNRNCGSGGTGSLDRLENSQYNVNAYISKSGSGYAFGGGAGSGGGYGYINEYYSSPDVDATYPMRGGDPVKVRMADLAYCVGGVGNPVPSNYSLWAQPPDSNNFGCGGRIIIFCNSFKNNGIISVNGTDTQLWFENKGGYATNQDGSTFGGASGAGAVDLFYTTLITQGTITASGGKTDTTLKTKGGSPCYPGAGGNGSITLTQWTQSKVVKETVKYFSQSNVDYLLTQMAERIKESRMGE